MNEEHIAAARLAHEHLELRLRPVQRALRAAVVEQKRANAALARPDVKPLCVSDAQVDQLLQQVGRSTTKHIFAFVARLTEEEKRNEARLRVEAAQLGAQLPLDALQSAFALAPSDVDALVICAAVELHRGYGRIFAFVQDELTRQLPTIDTLCAFTAGNDAEWNACRRDLGVHGALRRLGLLIVEEGAQPELAKTCHLAPRALRALTDPAVSWRDLFCDPTLVRADAPRLAQFEAAEDLRRLARGLQDGTVNLLGLWGTGAAPLADAVKAVVAQTGRPLRRWPAGTDLREMLALSADTASVLWIETGRLHDEAQPELAKTVATLLEQGTQPVVLSGEHPWRPTEVLATRNYAELTLTAPDVAHCARQWLSALPGLGEQGAADLAARYRMSLGEQAAVARASRVSAALAGAQRVGELCRMVAQKKSGGFARAVVPRRGPDDLVLPECVRSQVVEIPRFYRALSHVNEVWGFGRMMSGGGLKALFTGDSGTGKTLAAEVIAHELDLPLLKVDLAQLVSKWVGETEKNIDSAFREAEACHAILFFDEADTLFGKRGEIQQGSDRYANLETGFLLQRLEQFSGLAVLASNLRDEIDPAFIRRFQVLLHFPRPQVAERVRLWAKAFPPEAPLHPGVDLSMLAAIDLTGAGIVSAGHTAALLAADAGSDTIRREHVAAAIQRQFHREARILPPNELARVLGMSAPQSALHQRRRDATPLAGAAPR